MAQKIKLPKKLYDELVTHERNMSDMFGELDKAEECGIECEPLRDLLKQQLEEIATLKKNYGPRAS